MKQRYSILLDSGSCQPARIINNEDFGQHPFYDQQSVLLDKTYQMINQQFKKITREVETAQIHYDNEQVDLMPILQIWPNLLD